MINIIIDLFIYGADFVFAELWHIQSK